MTTTSPDSVSNESQPKAASRSAIPMSKSSADSGATSARRRRTAVSTAAARPLSDSALYMPRQVVRTARATLRSSAEMTNIA